MVLWKCGKLTFGPGIHLESVKTKTKKSYEGGTGIPE
jgi:hypothetical protein